MRYGALRVMAWVMRVIGWSIVVVGLVGSCVFTALAVAGLGLNQAGGNALTGLFGGGGVLLLGLGITLLWGVPYLAVAEFIFLFMDMEQNTREMATALKGHAEGGTTSSSD